MEREEIRKNLERMKEHFKNREPGCLFIEYDTDYHYLIKYCYKLLNLEAEQQKEIEKLIEERNAFQTQAGAWKKKNFLLQSTLDNITVERVMKILCVCDRLPYCEVNGEICGNFKPRKRKAQVIVKELKGGKV